MGNLEAKEVISPQNPPSFIKVGEGSFGISDL